MGFFDFENMRRWGRWFVKLPRVLRILVVAWVVVVIVVLIYSHYGKFQSLKSENRELEQSLRKAQDKIASLRSSNAELHRENLHYKELLDPIRQKAAQLYPALETDAALAKLAEDIETVRELATRDIYRPLSPEIKRELVSGLQEVRNRYRDLDVNLSITPEKGNQTRDKVARELSSLFVESGFQAKATGPVMTNLKGEVLIMLNPNDVEFANELYKVIGRFINTRFNGWEDANLPKGTMKIHIIADPLFSPDGIVTFR